MAGLKRCLEECFVLGTATSFLAANVGNIALGFRTVGENPFGSENIVPFAAMCGLTAVSFGAMNIFNYKYTDRKNRESTYHVPLEMTFYGGVLASIEYGASWLMGTIASCVPYDPTYVGVY